MPITVTTVEVSYNGNAVASQYAYTFRIDNKSAIEVYVSGVQQTEGTNYTVSGVGETAGGTVSFISGSEPASGTGNVKFYRNSDPVHSLDYSEGGSLPVQNLEASLDRLTMVLQEHHDSLDNRVVRIPRTHTAAAFSGAIPDPGVVANRGLLLRIRTDGTGIDGVTSVTEATDVSVLATHVTDIAELRTIVPVSTRKLYLKAHTTEGDGGHGIFRGVTGAAPGTYVENNGTIVIPAAGDGSTAWLREYSGATNVRWFGAIGDGTTDDTTAIQAALDVGSPVWCPKGTYLLTDKILVGSGQLLFGDGVKHTLLYVRAASFNMSATGVVQLGAVEPGGQIDKIGFNFDQPDTSTRASFNQFPPAILVNAAPRFKIGQIQITGGYDGINLSGNCGGGYIELVECGAINRGLYGGGSLDFTHINNFHFWPFGFTTANQLIAWADSNTYAADLGRYDGLDIHTFSTFQGKVKIDGSGPGLGNIGTLQLDGKYGSLIFVSGSYTIGSVYATTDATDDIVFDIQGGNLSVGTFTLLPHTAGSTPFVKVSGTSTRASFGGGHVRACSADAAVFQLTSATATLTVGPVYFDCGTNQTRTVAMIDITAGRAIILNPRFNAIGTGSGNCIAITSDANHVVIADETIGWPYSLPATTTVGYYRLNGLANDVGFFTNNKRFKVTDTGGTVRDAFGLDGSDNMSHYQAGASTWRVMNQAGSSAFLNVLSTGETSTREHYPVTDDTYTLGKAANRWNEIFCTNATINTSDDTEKEQIRELAAAEKRVALKLKTLIRTYKFTKSVEKKGPLARVHVGLTAQSVKTAFESEGLDPYAYSMLCKDTWEAVPGEHEAGERYGLRYNEVLGFIISAL